MLQLLMNRNSSGRGEIYTLVCKDFVITDTNEQSSCNTSAEKTLPKEKGLIQELFGADVFQWKIHVDEQEERAEDGDRLQTLQARLPAGQRPRARLLQPIGVCLETKEWSFGGRGEGMEIKIKW